MPDDIGGHTLVAAADESARPRRLIERLESTAIGTRAPDGAVMVRRSEAPGCILYGPYVQLPAGPYRLTFRCRSGTPRQMHQPVLGVEAVVLSRFQLDWRDFTAAELATGTGWLDFAVPAEYSLHSGNEGRIEFRFCHLGNADLAIEAIDLEALAPQHPLPTAPRWWRLLGRLQPSWLGRRSRTGSVAVRRGAPAGCLVYGGWPYLRLPRGAYRLIVRGRAGASRAADRPALRLEVFGRSRWRSQSWPLLLTHRPATRGVELAVREVAAAELAAGPLTLDFSVPVEMALEAGADAPLDIRLHHYANAPLTIDAVDVLRIDDGRHGLAPEEIAVPVSVAARLPPSGRRKVVLIGNCQMETVRQGFARVDALNSRFEIKYHFVQLPRNLHEFALRDLESCDTVLAQDIRLWEEFPLRDRVRASAEVKMFPLVRFASLWPFDTWNGPGDKESYDREAPNLTFAYLDGLLGRLRREIPDPEERFRAYQALDLPRLVNYRRLHELEARRLAAMDERYGITIGAYVLENFQRRRVFHTTVRPNWQVFTLLLQYVADLLDVKERITLPRGADTLLRNPQVPIHPKVARDLGVKWVDENTRYLVRGREMTWEAYVRSYIAHYG